MARHNVARQQESRTRDNLVYAFGSIVEVGSYLDLDDLAVCGLEAHGGLYALWIARCAWRNPEGTRATFLREIFGDPERLIWCRGEGARIRWRFLKAAYDTEHAAWLSSAAAQNKQAAWRKKPSTVEQQYMVSLIRARGEFADPGPMKRGQAHDWIAAHGGDPKFWQPPQSAPEWT